MGALAKSAGAAGKVCLFVAYIINMQNFINFLIYFEILCIILKKEFRIKNKKILKKWLYI